MYIYALLLNAQIPIMDVLPHNSFHIWSNRMNNFWVRRFEYFTLPSQTRTKLNSVPTHQVYTVFSSIHFYYQKHSTGHLNNWHIMKIHCIFSYVYFHSFLSGGKAKERQGWYSVRSWFFRINTFFLIKIYIINAKNQKSTSSCLQWTGNEFKLGWFSISFWT